MKPRVKDGGEFGATDHEGGEGLLAIVFVDGEGKNGLVVLGKPTGSGGLNNGPDSGDVPDFRSRFYRSDGDTAGDEEEIIGGGSYHADFAGKWLVGV